MAVICSTDELPKVLLFYPPQMAELARSIAKESRCVQLGTIDWEQMGPNSGNIFPSIRMVHPRQVKGASTVFLASFDTPDYIYEQLAIMTMIPRLGAGSLKIVLPFFPSLTLQTEGGERGSGKVGDVPTSRTLARLLSCVPKTKTGPTEMVMFDIHHLQERFYFEDNVVPRLETAMDLLIARLDASLKRPVGPGDDPQAKAKRRATEPNVPVIAFPDESRAKRLKRLFPGFSLAICTRMQANGKVVLLEGDVKGRRVVLVDDLIFTGRTTLECGALLKSLGATELSCYVTHPVFSYESWLNFVKGPFERVYVTDSIPSQAAKLRKFGSPFEVLSLAPLIAPIIEEEALLATPPAAPTLSRL